MSATLFFREPGAVSHRKCDVNMDFFNLFLQTSGLHPQSPVHFLFLFAHLHFLHFSQFAVQLALSKWQFGHFDMHFRVISITRSLIKDFKSPLVVSSVTSPIAASIFVSIQVCSFFFLCSAFLH